MKKVAIVTRKELEDPKLQVLINLENGAFEVRLKYTCPHCAGHGCHSRACDDEVVLAPEDVISTLGPESKILLTAIFDRILSKQPASSGLKEWLITPPPNTPGWRSNIEGLTIGLQGELKIINYISDTTVLVEATQLVADLLRASGFSVNLNGTKKAISR